MKHSLLESNYRRLLRAVVILVNVLLYLSRLNFSDSI